MIVYVCDDGWKHADLGLVREVGVKSEWRLEDEGREGERGNADEEVRKNKL